MVAPTSRLRESLNAWLPTLSRYLGLAGLVYELVLDKLRNPTALMVFAGLLGLPDVLSYRTNVQKNALLDKREKDDE